MTDSIQDIPFAEIRPSPLNTRKAFDAQGIERLADSIAAQGIQQNLVARRIPNTPSAASGIGVTYELVAGERRTRAFALLVERGQRTAQDTLPVRVIQCGDTELLELNLIENLQRQDLHPLDEAEGYAALVAADRSIAQIAFLVPFTRRHVELRLALADNLAPEAKAAFRDGDMTLAQARTLAAYAPPERQAGVVERIRSKDARYETAADLKETLAEDMMPAAVAFFDPALYDRPRVRDPDDGAEYFVDVEAFNRLQDRAVQDMEAKLKETYAWVQIQHGHYFQDWQYGKSKNKKIAGAVIFVHKVTREVKIYNDLLTPEQVKARDNAAAKKTAKKGEAAAAPEAVPPEAWLPARAGLKQAKIAKTQALRAAVISSGRQPAMIAVVLALMGARADVHLRREQGTPDDEGIVSPAVCEVFAKYRPRFKGALRKDLDDAGDFHLDWPAEATGRAFEILIGFAPAEIEELFTALVASTLGSYPGYQAELGDGAAAAGLARECGADPTAHWTLDEAYLKTCNKRPLQRIAASIAIAYAGAGLGPGGPMTAQAIAKMKAKDLRGAILAYIEAEPDAAVFLPAPFHFGTHAELLAMAAPPPAEAPRAEPAKAASKTGTKTAPKAPAKSRARAKIKSPTKIKEARTRFAKKAGAKAKAAAIAGFRP